MNWLARAMPAARNIRQGFLGPLALVFCLAASFPNPASAVTDDLIEVYDRDHRPLRTAAIEISPKAVDPAVEKTVIKVHVTLTGPAAADGELMVRQIGGNEFGAFYGRLVPYKAGQDSVDLECHINPIKNRSGAVIVQALITSSYKALAGAVTTELQVGGAIVSSSHEK